MTSPFRRLRTAVERWWWPRSAGPRRLGRAARRELSILRSRLRLDPARVVWLPADSRSSPWATRFDCDDFDGDDFDCDDFDCDDFELVVDGDASLLPPETREALLLVAVACGVDVAIAGAARPADGLHASGPLHRFQSSDGSARAMLLRLDARGESSPVVARLVPFIADGGTDPERSAPLTVPPTRRGSTSCASTRPGPDASIDGAFIDGAFIDNA